MNWFPLFDMVSVYVDNIDITFDVGGFFFHAVVPVAGLEAFMATVQWLETSYLESTSVLDIMQVAGLLQAPSMQYFHEC